MFATAIDIQFVKCLWDAIMKSAQLFRMFVFQSGPFINVFNWREKKSQNLQVFGIIKILLDPGCGPFIKDDLSHTSGLVEAISACDLGAGKVVTYLYRINFLSVWTMFGRR